MAETTAGTEGPDWSAKAPVWIELWAHLSDPARAAVADATGIGTGTRVLDVGCGSGEFCALAAGRGAAASGIDAAEGMIEHARLRLPDADLRVGPMEALPWADESFDVVCGFNSFQFAADVAGALREAGRVTRPGGLVSICNWASFRELFELFDVLREELAPDDDASDPGRPRVGEPGVVERLAAEAGLEPGAPREVDVPYEAPDQDTLVRAVMMEAAGAPEDAVRAIVDRAGERFRRPDGSYRFENRFRYVIARR
ncbi:MAG TPA: class I SAM-dependent methyltransferase [Solirubrobacteraceae bacterium]|nr:class I SAM-dependent methyltransferase [Solirubrobacteraceae bacterium]